MSNRASRNAVAACAFLSVALFFTGCGSLHRSIAFGPLTAEDMKYAATLPADPVRPPGQRMPFDVLNSAQYVMPAFPVYVYMKYFARMESAYCIVRGQVLFLLASESRVMLLDTKGMPAVNKSVRNLFVAGGIDSATDYHAPKGPSCRWRVRIFEIPIISATNRPGPGIGPCFGFGTGYLKILWIPIINKWKLQAPPRPAPSPAPTKPAVPAPTSGSGA